MKRRNVNSSASKTILILIIFVAFCSIALSGGKTFSKYLFNKDYDVTIGSSEKFSLTDISDILAADGVKVTKTLTAGALTPSAAGPTATYKWFKSLTPDVASSYSEIAGANANTYNLEQDDFSYYIKVQATGDNVKYYGDVQSGYVGPVEAAPATQLQSVTLSGADSPPQINSTLTPTVQPADATVTYQWFRSINGTSQDTLISTSPTYQITSSDFGCYIIVQVTGYDGYAGTKTAATSAAVGKALVTAVSFTGTLQVGQALTAAVTPSAATATYQWFRATTTTGTWTSITSATTSTTYTLVSADYNNYIKVVATGTGDYTGTPQSISAATVVKIPVTAVSFTGTLQIGQALTAAVTPSAATVTYQWFRATTTTGTWTSITSATTSTTYTLVSADYNNYIKVVATGTGDYTGSVESVSASTVVKIPVTAVALSALTPVLQDDLTVTVTPIAATVTYQWYRATSLSGTWTSISGATSATYPVITTDCGCYLKVIATGTGDYTGAPEAATTSVVAKIPLTAVTITGDNADAAAKYSTLTAAVTPSDAVVTYQWYVSSTNSNTAGTAISGATSSTWTVPASTTYYSKYIYVIVTASSAGQYTGSASSTCVAIGASTKSGLTTVTTAISSGSMAIGKKYNSTVKSNTTTISTGITYQWQNSDDGITYTAISGATSSAYTLVTADNHHWVRVMVTGTTYVGIVYSTPIGVNTIKLGSYIPVGGTALTGSVTRITSGTGNTTVSSYKWQKCLTSSGTFADISGATTSSYTPVATDFGYYLKVAALLADGTTVYSTTTEPVAPAVTAIALTVTLSPTSVPADNNTVMTATVTPSGALVTYDWQFSTNGTTWVSTSTDSVSHTVTTSEWSTYTFLRVVVTSASPAYSGSATSSNVNLY